MPRLTQHPIQHLLPALLLLAAANAGAAALNPTLNLCPGMTGTETGTRILDSVLRPSGASLQLLLHEGRIADCETITLQYPPRWARLLDHAGAQRYTAGMMLQTGRGESRSSAPQDVIELDTAAAGAGPAGPALMMPGSELLPRLQAGTFGAEGRASLRRDGDRLVLECGAGERPAGALLRGGRLSLPAAARLALRVDAEATAAFRIAAADAAHDSRGDALTLGSLDGNRHAVQLELPQSLDNRNWRSWVLECPRNEARLTLHGLRLAAAAGSGTRSRALWVWQPQYWRQQDVQLFELLAAQNANTVYISVPLQGEPPEVEQPAALQRFIGEASRRGLQVWAVAGDPRAVLPGERQKYAALAEALASYNRKAPPASRLAGLQLDIEPYLNPGYAHDPEGWLAAYVETLALIRPRAAMPIDVAVPFWWGGQRLRGSLFLDALKPLVEMVTVMNYRTDAQQLMTFAEPFLSWGTANGKQIRIGLESGPIPDESLHVYRRAGSGDLWLMNIGRQHAVLLMLDAARANPAGISYSHSHTINRGGDQVTFQRNPEALRKLLPQLEDLWRAWPSFAGVALHGLDQ